MRHLEQPVPRYVDEAVALYVGDGIDVMRRLATRVPSLRAAAVLTDPPFSEHTHANAKRDTGGKTYRNRGGEGTVPEHREPEKLITFASWTERDVARLLEAAHVLKPKWFVAHLDWTHAAELKRRKSLRGGWSFIRLGVWVKDDPAPSFSGDRPGQGWESIAFLHHPGRGALAWNGGGDVAVFRGPRVRKATYPSEKPLWLARHLVELFSNPGDLVVDPCCGSGTFVRAAKETGRRAIGVDISPEAIELAAARMGEPVDGRLPLHGSPVVEQHPLFVAPAVRAPDKEIK